MQLPFFRFPFFDSQSTSFPLPFSHQNPTDLTLPSHQVSETLYAANQTYTLGQQFILSAIPTPAPIFRGPVDIVVGHCEFPSSLGQFIDQAAATIPVI